MKPSKTVYDLGRNRHGQPLTLEQDRQGWTLIQQPANQRDETQRIAIPDILAAGLLEVLP